MRERMRDLRAMIMKSEPAKLETSKLVMNVEGYLFTGGRRVG